MGFFAILKLISQILGMAKDLMDFIEANKDEAWFQNSTATFGELRKTINDPSLTPAQKSQKYRDAGNGIAKLIGGL